MRILKIFLGIVLMLLATGILWLGGRRPVMLFLFPTPLEVTVGQVQSGEVGDGRLVRVRGRGHDGVGFFREMVERSESGREVSRQETIFSPFTGTDRSSIYIASNYPAGILASKYNDRGAITGVVRGYWMDDHFKLLALSLRENIPLNEGGRYLELVYDGSGHYPLAVMWLLFTLAGAGVAGYAGYSMIRGKKIFRGDM